MSRCKKLSHILFLKKEPVSKRSSLFKVKEGENFNHRDTLLFRGLKFESDIEIGQNGTF